MSIVTESILVGGELSRLPGSVGWSIDGGERKRGFEGTFRGEEDEEEAESYLRVTETWPDSPP